MIRTRNPDLDPHQEKVLDPDPHEGLYGSKTLGKIEKYLKINDIFFTAFYPWRLDSFGSGFYSQVITDLDPDPTCQVLQDPDVGLDPDT